MKRSGLLIGALVAGCSDDVMIEPDATAVDAEPAIDAAPDTDAITPCTPASTLDPPTPIEPPNAGTYCVLWNRLDGGDDPFPRYFDRVDVQLDAAHWYTSGSGGTKAYDMIGSVGQGCLALGTFTSGGGINRSDPMRLCWSSAVEAHSVMTWRSAMLQPTHWSLCLYSCPP